MKTLIPSPVRVWILSLVLLPDPGHALVPVSDNFNSAGINLNRWSVHKSTHGHLKQANGHVQVHIGPGTSPVEDYGALELVNNQPGYNESWQVIADFTNTAPGAKNVGCGIWVVNADDAGDAAFYDLLAPNKNGRGSYKASFSLDAEYPSGTNLNKTAPSTSASLRVTFSKTTKILTFYYDSNGPTGGYQWTRLGTYSTTGAGGDRRGNWNMNPTTGRFNIRIGGFANERTVPKGKLRIDNFKLKAL